MTGNDLVECSYPRLVIAKMEKRQWNLSDSVNFMELAKTGIIPIFFEYHISVGYL